MWTSKPIKDNVYEIMDGPHDLGNGVTDEGVRFRVMVVPSLKPFATTYRNKEDEISHLLAALNEMDPEPH